MNKEVKRVGENDDQLEQASSWSFFQNNKKAIFVTGGVLTTLIIGKAVNDTVGRYQGVKSSLQSLPPSMHPIIRGNMNDLKDVFVNNRAGFFEIKKLYRGNYSSKLGSFLKPDIQVSQENKQQADDAIKESMWRVNTVVKNVSNVPKALEYYNLIVQKAKTLGQGSEISLQNLKKSNTVVRDIHQYFYEKLEDLQKRLHKAKTGLKKLNQIAIDYDRLTKRAFSLSQICEKEVERKAGDDYFGEVWE